MEGFTFQYIYHPHFLDQYRRTTCFFNHSPTFTFLICQNHKLILGQSGHGKINPHNALLFSCGFYVCISMYIYVYLCIYIDMMRSLTIRAISICIQNLDHFKLFKKKNITPLFQKNKPPNGGLMGRSHSLPPA